jgi:hypothetical protein
VHDVSFIEEDHQTIRDHLAAELREQDDRQEVLAIFAVL